jgi:hypothetical protein
LAVITEEVEKEMTVYIKSKTFGQTSKSKLNKKKTSTRLNESDIEDDSGEISFNKLDGMDNDRDKESFFMITPSLIDKELSD